MHPFSNSWLILILWKPVKTHFIVHEAKMPFVMKNIIFWPITQIVLVWVDCFSPLALHNRDVTC